MLKIKCYDLIIFLRTGRPYFLILEIFCNSYKYLEIAYKFKIYKSNTQGNEKITKVANTGN